MTRDRRSVAARASVPAAVAVELLLYLAYQGSDARFHWFTHFFVGASVALVAMAAVAWRHGRPVTAPLGWIVVAHLYAMVPDLLFDAGIAHQRWMDIFLGHISSHFVPGQTVTWWAVFAVSAGAYLGVLDLVRRRAGADVWPLAVTVSGKGAPVVFVHGLGGSARYWDRLVAECASAGLPIRAIRVDLLGFGSSPKPADATYDVACHIQTLHPYVPPGSVVVGHSAGAIIAAALAAAHPEKVAALLLLGAPAFPDAATARREVDRLGVLARLTVGHDWAGSAACATMCAIRPILVPAAPRLAPDIPREVAVDFLHHSWGSYSRTLRHVVIEHRLAPDLVAGGRPVTLLSGIDDPDAPPSLVAAMVERLATQAVTVSFEALAGDHHLALREAAAVAHHLGAIIAVTGPAVEDAPE